MKVKNLHFGNDVTKYNNIKLVLKKNKECLQKIQYNDI